MGLNIILFTLLCFLFSMSCEANTSGVCNEKEKHALQRFKQALSDPANRLSSWSMDEDCCSRWEAVRCNNFTGRVVGLHLGNPYHIDYDFESYVKFKLGGEISSALVELEFLSHLNLSGNDFGGSLIPGFLGSMGSLRYLDLFHAGFVGLVPHQLGNLSSLLHLNLGHNDGLYADSLGWISHFSFLRYLRMDNVDLHREVHWLESVSMFPSLSELYLLECQLDKNMVSSLGYANFTSLTALDLSVNNFNQEMPNWLFNLTSLVYLRLSENQFKGEIPVSLGQLKYLEHLDLSWNSFHGPIPTSIGNYLSSLRLSGNPLINGTLPTSLWLLSNLEELYLRGNSLTGTISEMHFTAFSKLKALAVSETLLYFHVNSTWTPPFQLEYLDLASCKIGPKFPVWLHTQKSLSFLDITMSGIVDRAPNWFWKFASSIKWIHLRDNQISGDLSHVVVNSTIIDFSSNRFSGRLPRLSPNVVLLNMANNSFSGRISPFLCEKMNGTSKLEVLDMSINALSGELSECWMHWQSLAHINLGSNNLSGEIPTSMGSLVALKTLSLYNNSLYGGIPSSLGNCTVLGLINLGNNEFTGIIPRWIVERTTLTIIHLKSNKFNGSIPPEICQLSSLKVLNLADNSLSGTIPKCLNNISAMAVGPILGQNTDDVLEEAYDYEAYMVTLILNIKGRDSVYKEILRYVTAIDLSNNNLSGSISAEIFSLPGLEFLNLSHNHLTGMISVKIRGMKSLESLDLSRNHLSGEIPQSIANLTFLDNLNLSYNNLSGRIPSGTQLQSFSPLSFFGNAELCGAPLTKNCTEAEEESKGPTEVAGENREFHEISWFYLGMGSGFFVGFWGVCGALFFKRVWRHAYFQFLDDTKDWAYVALAIKLK